LQRRSQFLSCKHYTTWWSFWSVSSEDFRLTSVDNYLSPPSRKITKRFERRHVVTLQPFPPISNVILIKVSIFFVSLFFMLKILNTQTIKKDVEGAGRGLENCNQMAIDRFKRQALVITVTNYSGSYTCREIFRVTAAF
jgi:hypothetical protein